MSNLAWIAVIILVGVVFLAPLAKAGNRMNRVTPQEARSMVGNGAVLIDVRTPREYAQQHLPGAINIPLHEVIQRLNEIPDGDVVLYCRSGNRSQTALKILHQKGKENVYDLGAITRWNQ